MPNTNGAGITRESERVIRRLFDEALNTGKLEVIDEIVSANSTNHSPSMIGCYGGSKGLKKVIGMFREAFPGLHYSANEIISTEDKVIVQWTLAGKHEGYLEGLAPTGKRIKVTGTIIYRVADGKIQESWGNWDALGMMEQLGIVQPGALL